MPRISQGIILIFGGPRRNRPELWTIILLNVSRPYPSVLGSSQNFFLLISVLKWGIGLIVYLYLPSKHMGVFEPW